MSICDIVSYERKMQGGSPAIFIVLVTNENGVIGQNVVGFIGDGVQ